MKEKFIESKTTDFFNYMGFTVFILSLILCPILSFILVNSDIAIVVFFAALMISGILLGVGQSFSKREGYTNKFLNFCKDILKNTYDIKKLKTLERLIIHRITSEDNKVIILNYPTQWNKLLTKLRERIKTLEHKENEKKV